MKNIITRCAIAAISLYSIPAAASPFDVLDRVPALEMPASGSVWNVLDKPAKKTQVTVEPMNQDFVRGYLEGRKDGRKDMAWNVRAKEPVVFDTPLPMAKPIEDKGRVIGHFNKADHSILSLKSYAEFQANEYGIDPYLIYAKIQVESGWKLKAVSPKGARGLLQLMPKTAKWLGVTDLSCPYQNLEHGIKYYASLRKQFGSDELALAAYNWGPGVLRRNNMNYHQIPETRNHVRRVLSIYQSRSYSIAGL